MEELNSLLVVALKSRKHLETATSKGWYCISTKKAPEIVLRGAVQTIAFYHAHSAGDDTNSIRYYAAVRNVKLIKRKAMLPDGDHEAKADPEYYMIEFAPLIRKAKPIRNSQRMYFEFFTTSLQKFNTAKEIIDIYDPGRSAAGEVPKTYFNTVLVAIMNSRRDIEILRTQGWYRIPVRSAPVNVRNGLMKTIAFYFTRAFGTDQFSVRYYATVTKISIVKRKELLPGEAHSPKADDEYYKIETGPLCELAAPIVSRKGRRIIFIPTSASKFKRAKEINDLFNNSKLEDMLWDKLSEKSIAAERELYYKAGNRYFCLDFAIYCKKGRINVECDGDEFHTAKAHVYYDKMRNNLLESEGWSVLRFTWDDLNRNMDESVRIITRTIREHGGEKK